MSTTSNDPTDPSPHFGATDAEDVLDLTVTVCTLNEEANIEPCLLAIKEQRPAEVIVVDGDSTDRTRDIAARLGARVINASRKGLAHQRRTAVEAATRSFIALVDADHRPDPGAFATLLQERQLAGYDGIEAQIVSVYNTGYWDWAMEQNFRLTHNIPGARRMIGTPCIYRADVLKEVNFDPFFTGPSDDTDLCYRLIKAGYKLGVGTAVVRQEHRSDFRTFRHKWVWYGKGDAQFAWRHPERAASIIKHEVFNYPVAKSLIAVRHGQWRLVPFFVLCGALRHYGFLKEMTKMLLGKRVDRDIYRT